MAGDAARLVNPFKPGAGQSPPTLAGREKEAEEFERYLQQDVVTQNVVLTGLRGVGKTVLMDVIYKPLALKQGWVWVGSDLSEASFVDEVSLSRRLLTDLSLFTSSLTLTSTAPGMGLRGSTVRSDPLSYPFLQTYFDAQPGLNSDKLKATLELAWKEVQATGKKGILFAYDESQVVQDRKDKDEYPLALLLETFQSLQKKQMRLMLLLTGLPTLFPRLVASRTYAERMFKIQEIGRLDDAACRRAINEPLKGNAIRFTPVSIGTIIRASSGYPYFIQFICREAFDFFKSYHDLNKKPPPIPLDTLIRKLDANFFQGRWSAVPDRQRELLLCIAELENPDDEFTVNQIAEVSRRVAKGYGIKAFKTGDISTALPKLTNAGLIYKNRHGRYLLAVPLFHAFIKRQFMEPEAPRGLFDDFSDVD
jgi:hypothetical protein